MLGPGPGPKRPGRQDVGGEGVGRCRNILTGMGRCEEELATQNELDVERLHHPCVLFGLLYVCTYTVTHTREATEGYLRAGYRRLVPCRIGSTGG